MFVPWSSESSESCELGNFGNRDAREGFAEGKVGALARSLGRLFLSRFGARCPSTFTLAVDTRAHHGF